MEEEQGVRLRTVALFILAVITTVLLCFITFKTFGLSRDISDLKGNDVPHIYQRLGGLEDKMGTVKTCVENIQEQVTTLTKSFKVYFEGTQTPEERQKFREQIRQDVREEIRKEFGESKPDERTGE